MDEPPSSPPQDIADSPEKALAYYKAQYEQLESELAEFQESSKELEAELEKDVEQAEQRERKLKEKAESLEFEVDEWKSKYKQAKVEANAAQNTLQKEITTLRDENRTFMLQLRDIEVQNDDFERQARNTSSSLEDMESKLNVAIERNVMMEEDIKVGEQEREALRIETQRLREELSDLKIEAEIMQDKLRKRQLQPLETDITAPNTPSMDSPSSVASSPMITTPPDTKSVSTNDTVSETPTPPSPPMSEASVTTKGSLLKTPMNPPSKLKMPSGDSSTTPKPSKRNPTPSFRSSQGPSVPVRSTNASRGRNATPSVIRNAKAKAPATRGLPNSNSLTHIRTLTAQMQRLEQRVHSARSKLPAPITTPPRASPRSSSSMAGTYMPPSVTIRSRKRTAGSTASSTSFAGDGDETPASSKHVPRLSTSGISRLSFGPLPTRDGDSRPSSRASATSYTRPDRPLSRTATDRPASRTSMSGARTPLGHYSQSSIAESRRPRSSIGGNFGASHGHGHSQSVTNIGDIGDLDDKDTGLATPSRRSTFSKHDLDGVGSAIPLPASANGSGLPRRKSGGPVSSQPRRSTSGAGLRDVLETEESTQATGRPRKLTDVGETY